MRLPSAAYSWPFHNFGPGGLENALTMKKSSDFAQHILTNYGVDDEEFEGVLTKYIGVIDGRIRDGLSELINKRDRENPHWLQENRNINWDYTDRVVKQLVDETEIDFKNSRVNLSSANFSFPFYSFGARRAYPENIISEPKSNFGKYVISNYGVDETEYKEIYSMYMGVIAGRLKDHDENVNHLHLHESTEDKFLDTIVSQLVDETEIDFEYGMPHISAFPDPGFSIDSSFNLNLHLSENLFGNMFKSFWSHCRNVYGLTDPEIQKVWGEYKKEALKKIDFNKWIINESTEDNFLDKIVERLVAETQVFNDRGQLRANPPFFQSEWDDMEVEGRITGVVGGMPLAELIGSVESKEFDSSLAFMDFKYYCKQMYGLTWEECHEVWDKYREALYNTDFSHLYTPNIHLDESSLNPSYRESDEVPSTLARIVYQLVNETIIEDDEYGIPVAYPSWIIDEGFGGEGVALDILLDSDKKSVNFTEFHYYVNNMYGLDEDEIDYVWSSYKGWLWEKEQQNVYAYQKSLEDEELNESKKDLNSYIHTVVDKMVDGTHLKYKKTTNTIWVKLPFYIMLNNKGKNIEEVSSTYITSPTARVVAEIRKHLILIYGMDKWETDQAAIMYLSKMTEKINDYKRQGLNESEYRDYKDPLLSSKSHDLIKKVVDQLMDETQLIFPPQPPVQDTMETKL